MPYACIDVGSNTTRLLVADREEGQLRELMTQRSFTRIGKGLGASGKIPGDKLADCAEVVSTQVRMARELGAIETVIVATAAIRDAKNGGELVDTIMRRTDLPVQVLDGREEARLAFVGATKTLGVPVDGPVAVIDVGGGSTEIAIGTVADGAEWTESFRVGSGFLTDAYVRSDPPTAKEVEKMRTHVQGVFEGLVMPVVESAVAVGGSATSLRRLVGAELEHETFERSLRVLQEAPTEEIAQRFEISSPERAGVLPAGILVLEEISDRLQMPLKIGRGGLREGVILEHIASAGA